MPEVDIDAHGARRLAIGGLNALRLLELGGAQCVSGEIKNRDNACRWREAVAWELSVSNPRPSVPAIDRSPRLLIVEDELLVALIIEEMTLDIGYRVSGVAHTVPLARKEFAKRNFDVVLLDIGFDGQYGFEFADLLVEANVPFAFVTGYDYLVEPRHEMIPVLQKPFTLAQLRVLLATLVGAASSDEQPARTA